TSFQKIILSSGFFRRETAIGFYPWGQMRSIPHCSKAVFYIFVFNHIHNSATMHNLFPEIFQ
ncbi:MAG: hypothetical protein MSH14_02115, partial [Bacteroidales bacterium]|nr:hypothetical protein [Bacteroidales bacterium]